MTQAGETDNYTASMHAKAIIDHAGRGIIDYIIVNDTKISDELKEHYAKESAYPVKSTRFSFPASADKYS